MKFLPSFLFSKQPSKRKAWKTIIRVNYSPLLSLFSPLLSFPPPDQQRGKNPQPLLVGRSRFQKRAPISSFLLLLPSYHSRASLKHTHYDIITNLILYSFLFSSFPSRLLSHFSFSLPRAENNNAWFTERKRERGALPGRNTKNETAKTIWGKKKKRNGLRKQTQQFWITYLAHAHCTRVFFFFLKWPRFKSHLDQKAYDVFHGCKPTFLIFSRLPNQQRTLNKLLLEFRCRNFVDNTDWAYKSALTCKFGKNVYATSTCIYATWGGILHVWVFFLVTRPQNISKLAPLSSFSSSGIFFSAHRNYTYRWKDRRGRGKCGKSPVLLPCTPTQLNKNN